MSKALSEKQTSNGCGPEFLTSGAARLFIGNCAEFNDICHQHDKDYYTTMDRGTADFLFLRRMLDRSLNKKVAHKQVFKAMRYFIWVRAFGWISYYGIRIKRWVPFL